MEQFNKEVCQIKHTGIDDKLDGINDMLDKADKKIDLLFNRLNWFYILVITALGGIVATAITSCGGKL